MMIKTHHFSFDGSFPKSKYCDVKLSTLDGAGRDIAAHKVVLAAVSAKLEKLIDRAGDGVGPVTVRNIRFEILEMIVEFIYSGRVEIEDADVEDFQDGLDMLRIRLNKQVDQNETLRSINVPVSEVENVPVGEVGNVPPRRGGLAGMRHYLKMFLKEWKASTGRLGACCVGMGTCTIRKINVKAMHELPVICPSCGKEFNSEQMKRHTKLCPSKNAQVSQEMKQK